MEPIRLKTAAEWAGADPAPLPDAEITEITRNTRTLQPGALFVPLKGAKADGHDYIGAAEAAGAAAALCSRADVTAGIPLVKVPDTLAAAQKLAANYRTWLAKPVIGMFQEFPLDAARMAISLELFVVLAILGTVVQAIVRED